MALQAVRFALSVALLCGWKWGSPDVSGWSLFAFLMLQAVHNELVAFLVLERESFTSAAMKR